MQFPKWWWQQWWLFTAGPGSSSSRVIGHIQFVAVEAAAAMNSSQAGWWWQWAYLFGLHWFILLLRDRFFRFPDDKFLSCLITPNLCCLQPSPLDSTKTKWILQECSVSAHFLPPPSNRRKHTDNPLVLWGKANCLVVASIPGHEMCWKKSLCPRMWKWNLHQACSSPSPNLIALLLYLNIDLFGVDYLSPPSKFFSTF